MRSLLLLVFFLIALPHELFAGDLETLQGSWESTIQQNGKTLRIVKTIEGKSETLDVYLGKQLLRRHVVDFEIDDQGKVKTFAYRNGLITIGPTAGQKLPDGKYIYQLTKDRWTGVFGALNGDVGPVYLQIFRRVAEDPPQPEL